ncbi:3-isopropylmalate dehydratase small subunit [Puniceibacterium sp. IMCC21224]|uniref:3-isopropylmalate dehydratase small subunit n=1 Tax=Puniceibacterium sp. IMCC21224 TaxID=1618204 RepID=UPI00064DF8FF|nr:3-isopropylmalate dehydratase small subunit [Puniceibacterium sp. IMCC21224]KMK64861.1 3-isopropylmalate dehydratase, small subunit [Puniceibacterium sp. IMCC21224]
MSGWQILEGDVAALPAENVDTDQLIPARFMSTPRSAGYGGYLLHDIRQDDPDHILNRTAPKVLVTRRNFGSGSSREAAVYALVDFGIRAVFAPSFGDIFSGNAVNNGLLPARLDDTVIEELLTELGSRTATAHVDLTTGTALIAGRNVQFELDPVWREKLRNGWDDIDLTAQHAEAISAYRTARHAQSAWAWPHT